MSDSPTHRRLTLAAALGFCLVVGWTARGATRDPVWNLDGILYLSAALSWTVADPVERHRRVYDEFAKVLSPQAFNEVTTTSEYRRALSASPTALETQLRFCTNRPAYVAAVGALHGLGMNGAWATRMVSIVAYLAMAIGILLWLWTAGAGPLHYLAAAVLVGSSPFPEIAGLSDPDMLAVAPFAFAGWLMLGRGRHELGILVACLAIPARPDVGFLILLMIAWAALFAEQRLPGRRALVAGALVLAASAAIPALTGGAAVGTFHRFYFESRLYEPARMHETITLAGYWKAFRENLGGKNLYYPSVMALHLAITAVASVALASRGDLRTRPTLAWFAALWLYAPAHYVLFPDRSDRYFAQIYLLAFMAAVAYAFRSPRPPSRRDERPDRGR